MNWSVALAPAPRRTSLILMAWAFRTRSVTVSIRLALPSGVVHSAFPVNRPAPVAAGDVTVNVALTRAPGTTGSLKVTDLLAFPGMVTVHPAGAARLNLTFAAGASLTFVNDAVTSCRDPGVNVVARDRVTRATSYLAATMFACT